MILNGKSTDANGISENVPNVEIFDLNDASFTCNNFPNTTGVRYGAAGIIENTPIWCGGRDQNSDRVAHCEKLDVQSRTWTHAVDLILAGRSSIGKGNIKTVDNKG